MKQQESDSYNCSSPESERLCEEILKMASLKETTHAQITMKNIELVKMHKKKMTDKVLKKRADKTIAHLVAQL
jgi:hypothetical protein